MITRRKFSQCWAAGQQAILVGTLLLGFCKSSSAQIVPDNTLGSESSTVAPDVNIQGVISDLIDGGAIRGANLFHSFSQFNIESGRGAYFANPTGIQNILSRVTGANRSEILGRLGVLGDANLFLMNPNGIIFGANASLDIKGSFLATTANAVRLGDTGLFSASQPTTSNLLSVSPSALWFNAVAASPIVNRSQSPSSFGQPNSNGGSPGLQVRPDRTLALVGGDVLLEGGRLTATGGRTAVGGRIELGSVAGVGQVSLTQSGNGFVLGYDSLSGFGNILLSNGAVIDTSGAGGGNVQIRGGQLQMTQGSNIWSNTLGAENGGEVLIRATEVEINEGSVLRANVAPTATGTGGNLRIDTRRLLVRDGSQVSVSTFGQGKGSSLLITASEEVELVGTGANPGFVSGLFALSYRSGDAGDVKIDTRRFLVQGGAQIAAGTRGEGKGGSLQITAADSVELIGEAGGGGFSSGLYAASSGSGNAGDVKIDTRRLLVQGGAEISATTFSAGNGGSLQITASESVEVIGELANGEFPSRLTIQSYGSGDAGSVLRIDTRQLLVRDGAQITAGTFGAGKGGSLQITAAESVEVTGKAADGQSPSGLFTESVGSGNAGNLRIGTGQLLVRDGAVISSRSREEGTAGNIDITVRDALRANNGTIQTNTNRSAGGAITINAGAIRLFGSSDIISSVAFGADNGGNIYLEAGSILAFGDSDILAFARDGRGGDITLNTPAFFGQDYRSTPRNTDPATLDNNNRVDINATGTVASGAILLPDTSFIQNSLTELPENQIDTNTLLANSCIVRRNQPIQGSFTITGTGGLPQRPGEAQGSSFPTVEIEALPGRELTSHRVWQKGDAIVEPQGVYRLPNGKLVLSRNCL
ncbi:two-partner secretion domain-containing protein [Leptolyngbya sp. NIES-2104]|uniref:two-partner secretion domain-containing protein n=1 Tax=Leptolyngbya sp. NIES-2104 TaxID=1552121 RepID=UPI0006EC8AB1|nr:filamentous hemagglutinin N-terminal domain-containing protein [Leptolyngbya sp. NIES-2104]GAP94256.1 putative hemagglutinin-related protein [Leptolyngbya sp. NIES-2104]